MSNKDKICSVEGCEKEAKKKGFCDIHYRHYNKYGDPEKYVIEMHGLYGTPEYKSWQKMKERCYNPKSNRYKRYGGRGIEVCELWRNSFTIFYKDMGTKPFKGAQIDRIDNDGNYEPGNCKWSSPAEQAQNRSRTKAKKEDVLIIRKMAKTGVRQFEICKKTGFSQSIVSRIMLNKTWKNIK